MKKKIISILLVLVLAISATVALVACDKTGSEENKWKSMTDDINRGTIWVWEKGKNVWTGEDIWESNPNDSYTMDMLKDNTLPLNTYSMISFQNKSIKSVEVAKIKFTIEAEKEFLFSYAVNPGIKEITLKQGVNEIELDYEDGMLDNGYFQILCQKTSAGNYWSISNIKYLPKE